MVHGISPFSPNPEFKVFGRINARAGKAIAVVGVAGHKSVEYRNMQTLRIFDRGGGVP
jgi:hypothetical protein